jgi:hypothetical protein
MFAGVALGYGLVSAFVLSSAERNKREQRSHSVKLLYCGWTLMGVSFAGSGLMLLHAARTALGA